MDISNVIKFMNTLSGIRQLIESKQDTYSMMNKILTMTSEAMNCDSSAISQRVNGKWVVGYTYGFKENVIGLEMSDLEVRHAVLAVETRKPVIVNDAYTDPRVDNIHMTKWGIRSVIVAPLIINQQVWGVVFYNFYEKLEKFDQYTVEFSNLFTNLMSTTFENITLNEIACAAMEESKKSTNRYKTLFDSINEGFSIVNVEFNESNDPVNFRLIEGNPIFKKLQSYEEIFSPYLREVNPEVFKQWLDIFGRTALTGEPVRFEQQSAKTGRWYSTYVFNLDENHGTNVASLINDITEYITAKQNLEMSLKSHDEVFTNIAHELKTPLNVIFSANQLLEFYFKNGVLDKNMDKVGRSINTIKQNCYRFTKLISNIVDLSKIESGFYKLRLSNENIVEVVENIVQSVSSYVEGRNLSIIFDTDVEEKIIACDPEKIERIILNLISNAIKFSNPWSKIYVSVLDKDVFVEIIVKDTGVGMDNEHLHKIFDRFSRLDRTLARNAEGSGIGLSLVKGLVDLHGGIINVESQVGKGSTFKILLPVRVIENQNNTDIKTISDKVENIRIEFSDIYSL